MLRPSALRVTPLSLSRFGAEIAGISLHSNLASEPVAAQVRHALDEHGLLLFRGQSDLKAEHLVGLGSWFGTVFPLPPRFQHPRAPHADVLRMSNAEGEGLVGVGTTGWHMDGLSYATPFGVALLHIVEVLRRLALALAHTLNPSPSPSPSPSTSPSPSPSPPVDRHSKLDAL